MSVAGDAAVDSRVAATASAPALLSLRDLRVRFQTNRGVVHAVDGINLEITPGETLGLVGETGSGKSVTARSLLRLVPSPPAFYPSGEALFRPTTRCGACSGAGCKVCRGLGRVNPPCDACGGRGCDGCEQSGVDTIDLLKVPERRLRRIRGNHVAMIFQDPGKALNPALSIRQQIAEVFAEHRPQELLRQADLDGTRAEFFLRRAAHGRAMFWERQALRMPPLHRLHRRLEAVIDERVATALTDTRIPNPRKVMHSYPHELSGGMKQRVMIAQALACDPDLLIADEPTTALDVTIQVRILDLIAELQKRHGTAVLYISHDLSLVRRISDRVAVMYAGRLAEVGPTARIFANPLHPYTRAMLAATPRPGQRRGELAAIEGSVPELIDPEPSCRFSGRCPYAAPACRAVDPGLHARYGPDHRAACLLYDRAETIGADPNDMPTMHSAP